MVDATGGPEVEIVRLVFKSWEHRWVTGVRMAASTASAHRLMPETTTEPIYDILYERELLRDTMPLSPYGLRVRPKSRGTANIRGGDDLSFFRIHLRLGEVCPGWDAALPQPAETRSKYGEIIRAPTGDETIYAHYSLELQPAVFPPEVRIDKLLGRFSHRYVDKLMF